MKKKMMIYVMIVLAIAIVFTGGYYSAVFFRKIDSETKRPMIDQEEQSKEVLDTIREDSFLIHGTVESINRIDQQSAIRVLIDMNKNFKFTPFNSATRDFLIKESSVLYVAQKIENENHIAVLEESATIIDNDSFWEKGDLIVIKAEESFDFILSVDVFSIIEMWKIVE